MLNVSGVNFGSNPIIDREGKYAQRPKSEAKTPDMPADSFGTTKKSKKGLKAALIGLGVLAAAAVGLGIAAKTGKLSKIEAPEGVLAHTKNFFATVGQKVADGYDFAARFATQLVKRFKGDGADA